MNHRSLFLLFGISLLLSACSGISGQPVTYTADGVTLRGYLAYDKSIKGKRPGILVVHEWWGHNEYARERARMLAELGYTALAVDMYGDGKLAEHPDEAGKFMNEVMQNMSTGHKRFLAAYGLLLQHETIDPDRIAAIGYCFGGSVVLQMARSGMDIDGVVSFHGGLSTTTPADPGQIKTKILVCHAEDDQLVPMEQVKQFRKEMKQAQADFKIITYPGAKHSFTNPDADSFAKKFNLPLAYDETADKRSWSDMQKFLSQIFGK